MSWDRMCEKKSKGGLGFRKLRDFNIALLGKQDWRLMVKPNSLVGRIYRARYYPRGSFLTAKVGGNPSYIWRSIMEAHVLLKQGAVQRVRNGTMTSILEDPWLPDGDPYVHTVNAAVQHKTVDVLMNAERNSWDADLVNDIFDEMDARLILSIPLDGTDVDSWFWKYDKLGHYTVKTAYAALQEAKNTSEHNNTFSWTKLWNLRTPIKAKHFFGGQ